MVAVKTRVPEGRSRRTPSFRKMLTDRWFAVSIAVIACGFILFEVSLMYPSNELQRIDSGGGTYYITGNSNSTVWFNTSHSLQSHLAFAIPAGVQVRYTVFTYSYLDTTGGTQYYQTKVVSGTVNSTDENVYLPVSYSDRAYFANLTLAAGSPQNITVQTYAEFYVKQPFVYPMEIAGLLTMVAGVVLAAVRLTYIGSTER